MWPDALSLLARFERFIESPIVNAVAGTVGVVVVVFLLAGARVQ